MFIIGPFGRVGVVCGCATSLYYPLDISRGVRVLNFDSSKQIVTPLPSPAAALADRHRTDSAFSVATRSRPPLGRTPSPEERATMADPEVKTDAPVKKKNPNRLMVDEATLNLNSQRRQLCGRSQPGDDGGAAALPRRHRYKERLGELG